MLASNRSLADDNKTHWNREHLTGKAVATAERGPAVNVAYGIIAVLSFTSNLVFCLAMSTRRRRSLKTLHDQLILTLAVADAFTGLFIIVTPNYVINISSYPIPDGLAGEIFCRLIFSKFFIFTFGKGSVLTITCLAIERWFALIKPWQYQATFCSRKLCKYIAFIWLTSMLTQSYKFFYVQFSQPLCFFIPLPVVEKSVETSLIAVYVSATFFCPTIITWTAFIHIYVKINKSNVLKVNRGKEEKRTLLKMSAITSLMLTVCWFPTEVSYIINQYGFPILNFGTPFREFTVLLALANSFINPWIYIGTSRRYRQTLMAFFRSVAVY